MSSVNVINFKRINNFITSSSYYYSVATISFHYYNDFITMLFTFFIIVSSKLNLWFGKYFDNVIMDFKK